MKKIILIVLVILIARSCLSQMANPTQYNEWETSNSYIAGGAVAVLGSILCTATKSPIEITPQVGPSINWLSPDPVLKQFLQEVGTKTGYLYGYSAGSLIGIRKGSIKYKSGLFIESKGGSYSNNSPVIMTDNQGNIINTININTTGFSRLNYLTIPLTIGIQNDRLSLDVGGFVSLPISEHHQTTSNGITSTYEPLTKIVPNAGLMADAGIKIPMTDRMDFALDARFLSSLSKTMQDQIGKSFNQSVQLLFGLNIKIN